MPKNEKDYSGANNSNVDVTSTHETGHNPQKRKRTTRVSCQEARPEIQVIHQVIISEKPVGLIGEKVVYSEKYLRGREKRNDLSSVFPLPECGYFIITKAVLKEDGRVMVALYPFEYPPFPDGTNICLGNLKKYEKLTIK